MLGVVGAGVEELEVVRAFDEGDVRLVHDRGPLERCACGETGSHCQLSLEKKIDVHSDSFTWETEETWRIEREHLTVDNLAILAVAEFGGQRDLPTQPVLHELAMATPQDILLEIFIRLSVRRLGRPSCIRCISTMLPRGLFPPFLGRKSRRNHCPFCSRDINMY